MDGMDKPKRIEYADAADVLYLLHLRDGVIQGTSDQEADE